MRLIKRAFVIFVLFADCTTYIPTVLYIVATGGDWVSSQVHFEYGALENHSEFTTDGSSPGPPVSFGRGNLLIARSAVRIFGVSILNNGIANLLTEFLINRYLGYKKLIQLFSLVERISVAAWLGWQQSHQHFWQWRENNRIADQNGW